MKTSRLFNLSDKTTAHDRASGEEKMGSIERQSFWKQPRWAGLLCRLGPPRVCSPQTERVRKERLTSWTGDVYAEHRNRDAATAKKRKTVHEVVR